MLNILLHLGFWTVRSDHIILYLVDVARDLFAVPGLIVVHDQLRLVLFIAAIWHFVAVVDFVG